MHELAIAEAIASAARDHAAGRRVTRVRVRVGHLRQVVPSALAFGFEMVTRGTLAEGAELTLESVPVVVRCDSCRTESQPAAFPFTCDRCASRSVSVVKGEELSIDWIDVAADDAGDAAPRALGRTRAHPSSPQDRAGDDSDGRRSRTGEARGT